MLHFPPAWIPNVTLDDDKVAQAVVSYQWTSAVDPFQWVEKDDLDCRVGHRPTLPLICSAKVLHISQQRDLRSWRNAEGQTVQRQS